LIDRKLRTRQIPKFRCIPYKVGSKFSSNSSSSYSCCWCSSSSNLSYSSSFCWCSSGSNSSFSSSFCWCSSSFISSYSSSCCWCSSSIKAVLIPDARRSRSNNVLWLKIGLRFSSSFSFSFCCSSSTSKCVALGCFSFVPQL